MPKISQIIAREILNSRGHPTIESSVFCDNGAYGTASVPSGSSTGQNECLEIRDEDERYLGMGVLKAVNNIVSMIAPKLKGIEVEDQTKIDEAMINLDGYPDKSKLGANAILAVSIACLKAAANSTHQPLFVYIRDKFEGPKSFSLPSPILNIINGGKHGAGNLDFQEFHIIPSTRFSFTKSIQVGAEIYQLMKRELMHRNAIHSVGDEGGFAPNLFTNSDALELMQLVIKNSGYKLNVDVFMGLDIAASGFYKDGRYTIKDSPKALDTPSMINFYLTLLKEYPLFSLEDALDEKDWNGWVKLRQSVGNNTMIVGDDLLTTSPKMMKKAIETQACNAATIKPNQIGTITETVEVVKLAQKNNINTVFSHRSGETNDTFIADLAVGLGANFAKFGALNRGERVAKYNRLLEIESYLGKV